MMFKSKTSVGQFAVFTTSPSQPLLVSLYPTRGLGTVVPSAQVCVPIHLHGPSTQESHHQALMEETT